MQLTDKQIIEHGKKSFMGMFDDNPYKTENERRLWEIGYRQAKTKWFDRQRRNHGKKA